MLPVKLTEDPTWKLSPRHCGCQSQHMILTRMTLAPRFVTGVSQKKPNWQFFCGSSDIRADLQTSARIFRHPRRSSNIRADLQTSAQIFKHPHGSSNIRTDLQKSARIFKHPHGSSKIRAGFPNIRTDLQTIERMFKR